MATGKGWGSAGRRYLDERFGVDDLVLLRLVLLREGLIEAEAFAVERAVMRGIGSSAIPSPQDDDDDEEEDEK